MKYGTVRLRTDINGNLCFDVTPPGPEDRVQETTAPTGYFYHYPEAIAPQDAVALLYAQNVEYHRRMIELLDDAYNKYKKNREEA